MNSIETELGLMQAELDAERQAQKFLADWMRNYKGRLAEPKPQPAQPQQQMPMEKGATSGY